MEARIPPPVLMALLGALAWWLAQRFPQAGFSLPGRVWIAGIVGIAGLALNIAPKRHFRRAGTTVNPLRPTAATALVETGLHRYTRNPMYLGHALLLLAWALYLHNAAAFAAAAIYAAWVTRFQIVPEERALAARFGRAYADYRARVRRWL